MHTVKTFMDIKQLENNNVLPAAIIKILRQDLVQVIDNMQQLVASSGDGHMSTPPQRYRVAPALRRVMSIV